jgi:hypothetical protein
VTVSVLGGIAAGGDIAKELEGPRFVGAVTALADERQGSSGDCERVLEPVGENVGFAQIDQDDSIVSVRSCWRDMTPYPPGCVIT